MCIRDRIKRAKLVARYAEKREALKKIIATSNDPAEAYEACLLYTSDYKEGDLQFINEVKGGNVPKEFIPSVQKGFADCLSNGVLGGFPMTGLKAVSYTHLLYRC